jgi:hypothetical protein
MRVTRPELLQRPTGDHLHRETISCHQFGDKHGTVGKGDGKPPRRRKKQTARLC